MITGIDHVVIAVRDLDAGALAYETLLGAPPIWRSAQDGAVTALFALQNVAVELMAPAGAGETAARLNAALERDGEGLKSLVFAVSDVEAMHRRAEAMALAPEAIAGRQTPRGAWRVFRANTEATRGVRLFFMQRDAPLGAMRGVVEGLDHVVLRTGDPDAAGALYAGLGLDLRLDREIAGRRMQFFRCGDAIVEIAEDRDTEGDRLWGLSWRVADAEAARERLAAAGLDVSEVRAGLKPGTRVFSVRDRTCGVPTLMLERLQ